METFENNSTLMLFLRLKEYTMILGVLKTICKEIETKAEKLKDLGLSENELKQKRWASLSRLYIIVAEIVLGTEVVTERTISRKSKVSQKGGLLPRENMVIQAILNKTNYFKKLEKLAKKYVNIYPAPDMTKIRTCFTNALCDYKKKEDSGSMVYLVRTG